MERVWPGNSKSSFNEARRRIKEAHIRRARALSLAGLTHLDRLPDEIQQLLWLESLSLGSFMFSTKVEDIRALSQLKNLRRLHIGRTPVADIRSLAKLTNLQVLVLAETRVENFRALSKLVSLHNLNLYHTKIRDLSPLSELHR